MKLFFFHTTLYSLIFNILVTTTGVPVLIRFCKTTQSKEVLVFESKYSCCKKTIKEELPICPLHSKETKKGCCDFEKKLLKNNADSSIQSFFDFKFPKTPSLIAGINLPIRLRVYPNIISSTNFFYTDTSPPFLLHKASIILTQNFLL